MTLNEEEICIEYLENLKKCFVSLKCIASTRIEISRQKLFLVTGSNQRKEFELEPGFYFEPSSCRMDQKDQRERGWISFSISLGNQNTGFASKQDEERLGECLESTAEKETSEDWSDMQSVNQFSCFVCRSTFVSDFHAAKILHLPSDYWYEMTECWACHHEDYTTLPGQTGGTIFAQEHALLSGISYYLLHPKHIDLEKIIIRLTGRESRFKSNRWVEVCCKRCRNPLGEGFIDRDLEELSSNVNEVTTFKFMKSKISCMAKNVNSGELKLLPTRSMTHYFVRELIETANAHANYRFILIDEETFRPILALWVLNWKCQVGNINQDGRISFKPAMKILYKRIQYDAEGGIQDKEFIEKWQSDRMVEQFPHHHDSLSELILNLQKSTLSVPPSKRFFNGFGVAMLFY